MQSDMFMVQTSLQFKPAPDAILNHAGVLTYFWASGTRTPVQRAAAVTAALAASSSTSDVVTVGVGDFDLGDGTANGGPLFVACELAGQGIGITRFLNQKRIYDVTGPPAIAFGPAIAAHNGAYIHDLSIIGSLPPDAYPSNNSSTGFDNITTGATATWRRVEMIADGWTFYQWTRGCNYTLDQCTITGSRLLVAHSGSSGPLCNGTITGCTFNGLPDTGHPTGDVGAQQSGGAIGIQTRGGTITVSNCTFNMHGLVGIGSSPPPNQAYWYTGIDSWCPRTIGISDKIPDDEGAPYAFDPASPLVLNLSNCNFAYMPGSPDHNLYHFDVELEYAWSRSALTMTGCTGSGPGGAVRKSWDAGPALIAGASAAGPNGPTTTSAINTTGANLIVISLSWQNGITQPAISDSMGNGYIAISSPLLNGADVNTQLFYCYGGVVGAGHTFTIGNTTGSNYGAMKVLAFSGSTFYPFDQFTGQWTAGVSAETGSLTPLFDNELIVTSVSFEAAQASLSVDSGFVQPIGYVNYVSGNNFGNGIAYFFQRPATAVNVQWSGNNTTNFGACIASFRRMT